MTSTGKLLGPSQPTPHADELGDWQTAATNAGTTSPFEAKALYTLALLRHHCEAAALCYYNNYELPGYGQLCAAVETLGRCIRGCRRTVGSSGDRFRDGWRYLAADGQQIVGVTPDQGWSLRNYAAHGGTTPNVNDVLRQEVNRGLLKALSAGLGKWWAALGVVGSSEREALAEARITPLWAETTVIFIADMQNVLRHANASPGVFIDPTGTL